MKAFYRIFLLVVIISVNSNLIIAQSLRDLIVSNHRWYLPEGDGVFPVLIAIPGCSGVSFDSPATDEGRPGDEGDVLFRRHYPQMAELLSKEGFAVLLIDLLSAEGVINACSGEISGSRISEYITESLSWIKDFSYVDKNQIHLIGWSMGGWGLLTWLHDSSYEVKSLVQSTVVVYPSCSRREPLNTSLPLLMLLGGNDDIADPNLCEQLVEKSSPNSSIVMFRYEGARHGFDITSAPKILDVGNGKTLGYQEKAARKAWDSILRFLKNG